MKRVSAHDKVLLALYAELLRDDGDFNRVRGAYLDMDKRTFLWALMCLKTEGLIDGVKWIPPGATRPEAVSGLLRDKLHLTHEGYEKAEALIDVKDKRHEEKIGKLIEWCVTAGMTAVTAALDGLLA